MNSAAQLARATNLIASAVADGARLTTGGKRPKGAEFEKGYWLEPTIFADVDRSMRLWREEVFGPVLSVARWSDPEEALHMANDTEYGLTAAIWSRDVREALRFARRVEAGHIWINGYGAHYLGVPFGGKKSSGVGSDEGFEELLSYTEVKVINLIL